MQVSSYTTCALSFPYLHITTVRVRIPPAACEDVMQVSSYTTCVLPYPYPTVRGWACPGGRVVNI